MTGQALQDYAYGYPVMEKRGHGRPASLSDYLRLAALQYELDREEDAPDAQGMYLVNKQPRLGLGID